MRNESAIYFCLILFVIVLLITVLTIFTKRKAKGFKPFLACCIILLVWLLDETLFYYSTNPEYISFFFNMKMIAVPYLPIAAFLFFLEMYGYEKYITKKFILILIIIPIISTISSATNEYHHFFRTSFEVIQASPIKVFINIRGPGFYIHTGYTILLVIVVGIMILFKKRLAPHLYSMTYYLMVLGYLSIFLLFLFTGPLDESSMIDSNLIGASLGMLFFYFAIDTNESSRFIIARNETFDSLSDIIIVLNLNNEIIDLNKTAKIWLNNHLIEDYYHMHFDKVIDILMDQGGNLIKDSFENEQEVEFTFSKENNPIHESYNLKKQYIYGESGEKLGITMTFTNITDMAIRLRNLTNMSHIDALTGLNNRRGFNNLLDIYDTVEFFPLSIIIGDVNGLKTINDNLGHLEGDKLLQNVSNLLIETINSSGYVSRIGGDEFAILLPSTSSETASDCIETIRDVVDINVDLLYGTNLALGKAVKEKPEEDIIEIMEIADKSMYLDKRNDRRSRRYEENTVLANK